MHSCNRKDNYEHDHIHVQDPVAGQDAKLPQPESALTQHAKITVADPNLIYREGVAHPWQGHQETPHWRGPVAPGEGRG